ncbi:LemA family protein [Marinimicrobium sp. ABcell2]|uniref:LemA family protein n=1 Tax=Marinimicrobium sp. ABcell2 TaxID=3069751 RepID=UPI0027B01941|nr:LemA family protein [Marinimicrobium sp. ABcell2]MDQ2077762.1 LemA family protein [Marinimicrobium sp. ABcell2]
MLDVWLIVLAVLLLAWVVWIYNRLIRARNLVNTAWSDIDVQLTRRHDLIPQLVRTVKAYTSHERTLLETVTELRSQALNSDRPATLAPLENQLERSLGQIFILQENYPDLKADQNFAQLQKDLVETENVLQYARRFYNGAVRQLNDRVLQFPDLLIARLFRFTTADYYNAEAGHRENVSVKEGMQ